MSKEIELFKTIDFITGNRPYLIGRIIAREYEGRPKYLKWLPKLNLRQATQMYLYLQLKGVIGP